MSRTNRRFRPEESKSKTKNDRKFENKRSRTRSKDLLDVLDEEMKDIMEDMREWEHFSGSE